MGFLAALYQQHLASSTHSIRRSLENQANRLDTALKQAQDLADQAPPVLPDLEDPEETEDTDRERLEKLLDKVTLDGTASEVQEETAELHRWLPSWDLKVMRSSVSPLTKRTVRGLS